jgi:hypothetical protein
LDFSEYVDDAAVMGDNAPTDKVQQEIVVGGKTYVSGRPGFTSECDGCAFIQDQLKCLTLPAYCHNIIWIAK